MCRVNLSSLTAPSGGHLAHSLSGRRRPWDHQNLLCSLSSIGLSLTHTTHMPDTIPSLTLNVSCDWSIFISCMSSFINHTDKTKLKYPYVNLSFLSTMQYFNLSFSVKHSFFSFYENINWCKLQLPHFINCPLVPWQWCHDSGAMTAVPWQRCHDSGAMTEVPWQYLAVPL